MVEISNLTTNKIDAHLIKKTAEKVLKEENKKNARLSIVLMDPRRIKALNKKYRQKNRITDVLSFDLSFESQISGEIAICLNQVKQNAKKYGNPFEKELVKCVIHGILHLLGYEHNGNGAEKMNKKEQYYISKIYGKT